MTLAASITAAPPRKRVKRLSGWLWPLVSLSIILVVLEVASRSGLINPIIFPPPSAVIAALFELTQQPYFWGNFYWTSLEAVSGFLLGVFLGFVFGVFIGTNGFARKSLYPLAVALQSTPQVAIAPLFLIWFGFGIEPRVFFAALSCFFPILVSVVVGLNAADQDSRTLLRSLGASRWKMYRMLLLPASLPTLFAGIRLAVPAALVGAIVGEFVGGNLGLGVMVTTFNSQLQIAESSAVVVVLALMGFVSYQLVELADVRILGWRYRE
jgi:NitT/TauT family transport system permease protein